MSDIAFIGDRDTVWPFKSLGADVFFSDEHESVPRLVQEVSQGDFSVIFVTEDVYDEAKDRIDKFFEAPRPTFAIIPSLKGGRGVAAQIIRNSVRRAMGAEFI
jgi:V/A-type H+-transporting ATPase subunit F